MSRNPANAATVQLGRRRLLALSAVSPAIVSAAASRAVETACLGLTAPQMTGPFFLAGSPETGNLVASTTPGERLVLTGRVFRGCQPAPGVKLDFWQADAVGRYDRRGFSLRGHQFTDADGRYALVTVMPGYYPGRTRHIHVRLTPPGARSLTTQLYFPDTPRNDGDFLFDASLLVSVVASQEAQFDFTLPG